MCVCVCACAHMCLCTCTCLCERVCAHVCTFERLCFCASVRACACARARARVCVGGQCCYSCAAVMVFSLGDPSHGCITHLTVCVPGTTGREGWTAYTHCIMAYTHELLPLPLIMVLGDATPLSQHRRNIHMHMVFYFLSSMP